MPGHETDGTIENDSYHEDRGGPISSNEIETTLLPRCYPHFRGRPLYNGNTEALGWALDGIARAVSFIGAGAFFGPALIRIAKEAAGCPMEAPEGETIIPECNEKVYGIKPSSLLTTYTMIVGVSSACLLPLMGALVDYTPHRLRLTRIVSILFTAMILPSIFLSEENFFGVAIVQIFQSFTGWAQTALTYAYLPELTSDEHILNDYTKSFTMTAFGAMLLYLFLVIGSLEVAGYGDDDLRTNQVAMSIAFVVNAILLSYSWGVLFGRRRRMHELPNHKSLWTAGFIQLYDTGKHICKNYRALKWFYASIALSESALQALATIAITYMTDQLQFSAQENGIGIACMLLGSVPGAMISSFVTQRMDSIKSSAMALILLTTTTALFAIFLKGPDQYLGTYILAFVWGVGIGWKWTCDRLVASLIIPEGQDAELMGLFLFSGQCLSWMPPLIYTALNEAGVSQRIGVATLDLFFLFALCCYVQLGGYSEARAEVGRNDSSSNRPLPDATSRGNR